MEKQVQVQDLRTVSDVTNLFLGLHKSTYKNRNPKPDANPDRILDLILDPILDLGTADSVNKNP